MASKKQMLKYRGFIGSIEIDLEDRMLYGRLLYVNDLINYHADTLDALETEFQKAVDDYLSLCDELGRAPCKVLSGTLNIRIGEQRHQRVAQIAAETNVTINQAICNAVDAYKPDEPISHVHIHVEQGGNRARYQWSDVLTLAEVTMPTKPVFSYHKPPVAH